VNIQTNKAGWVPHDVILLRWTSAIKDKAEKLIGSGDGSVKEYLQSGAVSLDDVYVIAVNGCRLRNGPFSALHGVSQFPYALEAVFPIGPYEFRFDRQTLAIVGQGYQKRFHISKPSGSNVPTQIFLDSRYAPVSAIWAIDFNGGSVVGSTEPSAIVYNPKALQPLPRGFLPADVEYVASPQGEDAFVLETFALRTE
jgi:type I restriction enzyme S subunit